MRSMYPAEAGKAAVNETLMTDAGQPGINSLDLAQNIFDFWPK
jgi:hypothetical protein